MAATVAFEPSVFTLGIDGNDPPEDFKQTLAPLVFAAQHGAGGLQAVLPGLARLACELLLDAHRPEQGAGGRGADDPQADLGAARYGLVEHL